MIYFSHDSVGCLAGLKELRSIHSCVKSLVTSLWPLGVDSLGFLRAWWSEDNPISYRVTAFKKKSRSSQGS